MLRVVNLRSHVWMYLQFVWLGASVINSLLKRLWKSPASSSFQAKSIWPAARQMSNPADYWNPASSMKLQRGLKGQEITERGLVDRQIGDKTELSKRHKECGGLKLRSTKGVDVRNTKWEIWLWPTFSEAVGTEFAFSLLLLCLCDVMFCRCVHLQKVCRHLILSF